jgi:hypothetical protein
MTSTAPRCIVAKTQKDVPISIPRTDMLEKQVYKIAKRKMSDNLHCLETVLLSFFYKAIELLLINLGRPACKHSGVFEFIEVRTLRFEYT